MEPITNQERRLLEEFRDRISDVELDWFLGHDNNLVRWLRARDHNLDKAEEMFRKHQQWRMANRTDQLSPQDFPAHAVQKIPIIVSAKDSDFVVVVPFGQWDTKTLVEAGHASTLNAFADYNLENMMQLMRIESEKGDFINQGNIILDYTGFGLRQITSKQNIEFLLSLLGRVNDNYPEVLRLGVVVNAPKIFEVLFGICKPFLTARTLSKVHIYGSNAAEYRTFLRKNIPVEALPTKYGGAVISGNGYRVTDSVEDILENHKFKALPQSAMTNARVDAGDVMKVEVDLKREKQVVRWCFHTTKYDIGFRMLDSDGNDLVPLHLVDSHVNANVMGMYRAIKPGKYTLCFDNTHSRFNPKFLSYAVKVEEDH